MRESLNPAFKSLNCADAVCTIDLSGKYMGKLTAKAVEQAAPRDKEYKIHDGDGLFL